MRSLDEVIKALEICIGYYCSNAEHDVCPYFGESDMGCGKEPEKDALHYLKEYRETKKHLACLDDAEIRGDDTQVVNNHPLTWDELKSMEGGPVWVEERYRNGDLKSSGWWLIDYWYDDQICLRDQGGNPWNAHRTSIGRDWQAYRKERS